MTRDSSRNVLNISLDNDYITAASLRGEGGASNFDPNVYPNIDVTENYSVVVPYYTADYFGPNAPSDSESSEEGTDDETETDEEYFDDEVYFDFGGNLPILVERVATTKRVKRGSRLYNNIHFFDFDYEPIIGEADSIGVPRRDNYYDEMAGVLKKGMIFRDKRHVIWAVKDYSVRVAKCAYRVDTSNSKIWKVVCITKPISSSSSSVHSSRCDWWLCANFRPRKNVWEITGLGPSHDCLLPSTHLDHTNLCKNLIAMLISIHVEVDPIYSASNVQSAVQQEYGYEISYHKAHQSLQRARKNVYGTWESSVQSLPKYMEALQLYSSGTVVEWLHKPSQVNGVHMLKFVFWAFLPCIEAFKHCRKVITVDGTVLVGKYKHMLLMACAFDANQQIMPLAYAVVDSESYNSWHWFLHMVAKYVVRDIEGVCLISKRHPELLNAVQQVRFFQPPIGVHRFCLRDITSNFNTQFKSDKLKDMCYKAGSEPSITAFHKIMKRIKLENPEAFSYLDDIDKSHWTLSHDENKRCGILTTNMSECINGVLKRVRRLPISSLVRITFYRTVRMFVERLADAKRAEQRRMVLPDKIHHIYIERQRDATTHTVSEYNWVLQTAQVVTRANGLICDQNFRVSLSALKCSCGRWLSSCLPCSHAIRASIIFRMDPLVFVRDYYSTGAYVRAYSGIFEPLPDEEDWNEASFKLVHDPHTKKPRMVGRLSNKMDRPQIGVGQQYRAPKVANTSQLGVRSSSRRP